VDALYDTSVRITRGRCMYVCVCVCMYLCMYVCMHGYRLLGSVGELMGSSSFCEPHRLYSVLGC
jgi:hypothetical protein